MNYGGLYPYDTQNGLGYRVTLFVSGCGKIPKCKGCHNKKAWDFNYGAKYTNDTYAEIMSAISKPYIRGLSLLGGEVMDNLSGGELLKLVRDINKLYPHKDIYCWTGYLFENLIKDETRLEFIRELDVMIDGEFIQEMRNLSIGYAGSTNQRRIDVKKSLLEGRTIIWEEN